MRIELEGMNVGKTGKSIIITMKNFRVVIELVLYLIDHHNINGRYQIDKKNYACHDQYWHCQQEVLQPQLKWLSKRQYKLSCIIIGDIVLSRLDVTMLYTELFCNSVPLMFNRM